MRWSCTPDLKLACSDKKNKQMRGRDNHQFWPGDALRGQWWCLQLAGCERTNVFGGNSNMHAHTRWISCDSCAVVSSVPPCTKYACLCRAAQMGVWGDGCSQFSDRAAGRWSHCYSAHKHLKHVRHATRRHTRVHTVLFMQLKHDQ